jgi:serine/threonine protein kinase
MSICINPSCEHPQNPDNVLFCKSCGSELLLDNRYRALKQLGQGGFGKTYEVIDYTQENDPDQQKRIKVLKILIDNNPKCLELFKREAKVLSKFHDPGIPRVEPDDYFTYQPNQQTEPLYCLVMEKIEGLNLSQYIVKRGRVIPEKQAIQWLIQLVTILEKIHNENFFHRDIKPSNIMIRANGHLALIDFGAVRQMSQTFFSKHSQGQLTSIISLGYTPPEQMYGQALPQSDFFALGRTFVYLLTGQEPQKFYDPIKSTFNWHQAASGVSPLLRNFIDHLMAQLPQERPHSSQEILRTLKKIRQSLYAKKKNDEETLVINYDSLANDQGIEPSSNKQNTLSPKITFNSNPKSSPSQGSINITPDPNKSDLITPDFVSRCQEELTQLIGPMASIVCKRTISKNPELSVEEFVKKLAQKIPNQQQAFEFEKSLLANK